MKIICPECVKLGCKSKVFIVSKDTEPLYNNGYYNEEGDYCYSSTAIYGSNWVYYQCSNGHKWAENMIYSSNNAIADKKGEQQLKQP